MKTITSYSIEIKEVKTIKVIQSKSLKTLITRYMKTYEPPTNEVDPKRTGKLVAK